LGVILFEFLTGIPPFNDDSPEQIFQNILNRDIPWPQNGDEISESAHDLIDQLLSVDPIKRLGLPEIKSHPFFSDIHWDTLLDHTNKQFIPNPDGPDDTSYFSMEKASIYSPQESPTASIGETEGVDFGEFSFTNTPALGDTTRRIAESED